MLRKCVLNTKGKIMTKILLAALLTLSWISAAAAVFEAPEGCDKFHGEWTCEDPVGNSEASDGASQDRVTTSRGNLGNKACTTGPGNSGDSC